MVFVLLGVDATVSDGCRIQGSEVSPVLLKRLNGWLYRLFPLVVSIVLSVAVVTARLNPIGSQFLIPVS